MTAPAKQSVEEAKAKAEALADRFMFLGMRTSKATRFNFVEAYMEGYYSRDAEVEAMRAKLRELDRLRAIVAECVTATMDPDGNKRGPVAFGHACCFGVDPEDVAIIHAAIDRAKGE